MSKGQERQTNQAPPPSRADLQILLTASSASAALRELYELRKARRKSFSLAYICRQTGASKGYISDVFNGRRKLNQRYWDSFLDVFKLQTGARHILKTMLSLDRCRDEDQASILRQELERLRKAARAHIQSFPNQAKGMFFALEVFCAFGLFNNTPTPADLRHHYGAAYGIELEEALRFLMVRELIAFDGTRYRLLQDHIGFLTGEESDPLSYQSYLKQALDTAKTHVGRWCEKRDEAIFESTFLSADRATYQNMIESMRQQIHQMQADLESNQADSLLLFNVQLFPIRQKKS